MLLASNGKTLKIRYRGGFAGGTRSATGDDLEEFTIVVRAAHFRDVAALLDDDEEVSMKLTPRQSLQLVIGKSKTRVEMAKLVRKVPQLDINDEVLATVDFGALLKEISVANKFIAKSMQWPILTGIHLVFGPKTLHIEATDGFAIYFETNVSCVGPKEPLDMVVPAYDFQLCLEVCGAGDAPGELHFDGSKIAAVRQGAQANCSILNGAWPSKAPNLKRNADSEKLDISSVVLRRLISAARVIGAGADLRFVPVRTGIQLVTRSESGEFMTQIKGKIHKEAVFDMTSLALVAELGDSLAFELTLDAPLYVGQGDRTAWVMGRAY